MHPKNPLVKLLLFDIDGTLLLTGGAGRIAFEKVFEEFFGIKKAWGNMIPDGKTDPIIIKELSEIHLKRPLKKNEYDLMVEKYLDYFDQELPRASRFYMMPGIEALIPKLAEHRNYVLGIATGNFERAAWAKLKRAGLRDYFVFGGFGSDAVSRTELTRIAIERGQAYLGDRKVPHHQIYVIGDTLCDIRAGKENEVNTIAVASGKASRQTLESAHPDIVYDTLDQHDELLSHIDSHSVQP